VQTPTDIIQKTPTVPQVPAPVKVETPVVPVPQVVEKQVVVEKPKEIPLTEVQKIQNRNIVVLDAIKNAKAFPITIDYKSIA
jgi:hypothetical protein